MSTLYYLSLSCTSVCRHRRLILVLTAERYEETKSLCCGCCPASRPYRRPVESVLVRTLARFTWDLVHRALIILCDSVLGERRALHIPDLPTLNNYEEEDYDGEESTTSAPPVALFC